MFFSIIVAFKKFMWFLKATLLNQSRELKIIMCSLLVSITKEAQRPKQFKVKASLRMPKQSNKNQRIGINSTTTLTLKCYLKTKS